MPSTLKFILMYFWNGLSRPHAATALPILWCAVRCYRWHGRDGRRPTNRPTIQPHPILKAKNTKKKTKFGSYTFYSLFIWPFCNFLLIIINGLVDERMTVYSLSLFRVRAVKVRKSLAHKIMWPSASFFLPFLLKPPPPVDISFCNRPVGKVCLNLFRNYICRLLSK